MIDPTWHEIARTPMLILEYVGTFAGAMSGVRLASKKHFDWFGASVIGFITALGGGTLRDVMLGVPPFWMLDHSGSYVLTTFLAVVSVWLFGRHFIEGQVTWFVFDTIAISVFMVLGMEKTIFVAEHVWVTEHGWAANGLLPKVTECAPWLAISMGVITAVFGGVLRDICINEVPLIFRKELYAMACAAGGVLWYVLVWCGVDDPYIRYIAAVVFIFILRALAIKYHLGVPVLTGRGKHIMHRKPDLHSKTEKKNE